MSPLLLLYYAALLPRRGPHIASHSVCPSVRLSNSVLELGPMYVTDRQTLDIRQTKASLNASALVGAKA